MYLKELRQNKHLSQEQLASESGLSLRTIQRIESGHRVGYASLRALAVVFDINVDSLEQELYSMEKLVYVSKDFPLPVRLFFGNGGWHTASRQEMVKIEKFFFCSFSLLLATWLSSFVWDFPSSYFPLSDKIGDLGNLMGICSITQLFGAYILSVQIRIGDKYDIWSRLETTHPKGIFGFSKN